MRTLGNGLTKNLIFFVKPFAKNIVNMYKEEKKLTDDGFSFNNSLTLCTAEVV